MKYVLFKKIKTGCYQFTDLYVLCIFLSVNYRLCVVICCNVSSQWLFEISHSDFINNSMGRFGVLQLVSEQVGPSGQVIES